MSGYWKKVQHWLQRIAYDTASQAVLIWCIAAVTFGVWLSSPTLIDVDAFYHLGMAKLMIKQHGPVVDFPWLSATTLTQHFADHHLLYHAYLVPWVKLFGDLVGMKLATISLAASAITMFFIILRHLALPLSGAWSLLLLFNMSYAFRMGLSKATALASILLLVGYWLTIRHRWRLLVILGFVYVWAYGGWPLLLIFTSIDGTVRLLLHILRYKSFKHLPWWQAYQHLIGASIGVGVGLLIHPSFPAHFYFFWEQIVQIGFVNYRDIIEVGGEWYPTAISDFIVALLPMLTIMLAGVISFIFSTRRKITATMISTSIMAIVFTLMSLKSRRYIEYAVPWSLLAGLILLQASGRLEQIKQWWLSWRDSAQDTHKHALHPVIQWIVRGYLLAALIILCTIQALQTNDSLRDGTPMTEFAGAGGWLRQHATRGDIVFHDNWDDFPALWYQTRKPYYLVGLDPTFMYRFDARLYQTWRSITLGEYTQPLYPAIHDQFDARFVLVTPGHTALLDQLTTDRHFKLVYHDTDATIFRVIE